ncbi:MAG: chemotaxis protein CheW [Bacteroidales bacterium]|nr:chemotaxis protein CheW [Bacteroidales bacterium]
MEVEEGVSLSSVTSFKVGGEYFGFETVRIRHILEMSEPTKVPLAKEYVMGIINNHGNMIPVIDFRAMLGLPSDDDLPETSIVVVSVDGTAESYLGFKVDEVDEVFDYTESQYQADVVVEVNRLVQRSLQATLHVGDKFIYMINLDELAKTVEE